MDVPYSPYYEVPTSSPPPHTHKYVYKHNPQHMVYKLFFQQEAERMLN